MYNAIKCFVCYTYISIYIYIYIYIYTNMHIRANLRSWPGESMQICRGHPLWMPNFYNKCIQEIFNIMNGKCNTSYMMAIVMFCYVSHRLRDILKTRKILNLWPWKWRWRSRSRRTGLALFDWKCSTFEFFWILLTWEHIFTKNVT